MHIFSGIGVPLVQSVKNSSYALTLWLGHAAKPISQTAESKYDIAISFALPREVFISPEVQVHKGYLVCH